MIKVDNISKVYNGEYVFKDINFLIKENDRIAIIGNNGVGKTTLMQCILNDNYTTSGEVLKDKKSMGYLSQDVIENFNNTVRKEYDNIFKELANIEVKMKTLMDDIDTDEEKLKEYGMLESKYMFLGGYEKNNKIEMMMSKFGFSREDLDKEIKSFSGGQITKLALIKLLLITPNYLFLDEPTNHLDIDTITWLEEYLKSYDGAVIIISHDRYFIDRVANKIIEIENKTCEVYNTDFTHYLVERKNRYNIKMATYENQQQLIKTYQEFIERFRGKPSKIGQVNDRKNKLSKINVVEKPKVIQEKVDFTIQDLNIKKAYYVDIINADIGYDKVLIHDLNLKLLGGEKLAIIGENGVGKSTLLKTILKEIPTIAGNCILHHSINIGYLSQINDMYKDEDETLYDCMYKYLSDNSVSYIRGYLSKFLFKRDEVFKKIKDLSGGEKVRLTLAIFSLEKYDMIILDEPTNHLDFETKQILQNAIQEYKGTVICVSHDRYFIDNIAEKYLFLQKNKYNIFEGRYEDVQNYLKQEEDNKRTVVIKKVRNDKNQEKEIRKIEKNIEKLEMKKEELIKLSGEKEYYMDYQKSKDLGKEIDKIDKQLSEEYDRYESLI